ncbi:MAG: cytochrome P460 family protein [Gemmatimonadales bacterium]
MRAGNGLALLLVAASVVAWHPASPREPVAYPEGYRSWAHVKSAMTMNDADGAYSEGTRRQLDVMVKDSVKFASTGGWGFQRFPGDSKTELSSPLLPRQCFACHTRLAKDGLVLSSYRR